MRVKPRSFVFSVQVAADAGGLVSRAGTPLMSGLAARVGLARGLSAALGDVRERRGRHDPGRVCCDLAVMLANDGDCLADLGALRAPRPARRLHPPPSTPRLTPHTRSAPPNRPRRARKPTASTPTVRSRGSDRPVSIGLETLGGYRHIPETTETQPTDPT